MKPPYNNPEYPKYVNYDAINVDSVKNIPCDYYGVMGVPVSYLEKHNPNDFEIVGMMNKNHNKDLKPIRVLDYKTKKLCTVSDRLIPHNPEKHKQPTHECPETGVLYNRPYERILIKRKRK